MDMIIYNAYMALRLFAQKMILIKYLDEDAEFVLFTADISAFLILLMYSLTFGEFSALSAILVKNLPQVLNNFAAVAKFMLDFICDASAW